MKDDSVEMYAEPQKSYSKTCNEIIDDILKTLEK